MENHTYNRVFPLNVYCDCQFTEASSPPIKVKSLSTEDRAESMMGFTPTLGSLVPVVGGSTLAGGITGFAAKKLVKLVLALVGVQLAIIAYLDHQGILNVHWEALDTALASIQQSLQVFPSWLTALGATLPIGVGFVGGFLFGFKTA